MQVEQAKQRFAQVVFASYLGVDIVEVAHERAVLSVPYQVAHSNPGGTVNGGVTASILNLAGTLAAWTGIPLVAEPFLGTVDFSIQYLSAAVEEDVMASASVRRRGRDLFFLDGQVYTKDAKPICQGLMIYRAPDYAGLPRRSHARPELLAEPDISPDTPPASRYGDYINKLHIATVHESPGRVRLSMPCTANVVDERRQLHEGAVASLLDVAGTSAAWTLAQRQGSRGATIGMQLSYLNPTQDNVLADAMVQQRSEELFFSTVQITTATTRQLVAMGNVSYRILEARG
jgi:uncharacterized protein (TIGR00369 family)